MIEYIVTFRDYYSEFRGVVYSPLNPTGRYKFVSVNDEPEEMYIEHMTRILRRKQWIHENRISFRKVESEIFECQK